MELHALSCQDLNWKMSADNNDLPCLGEIVAGVDVRKLIKLFLAHDKEIRFTKGSAHIELSWVDVQLLEPIIRRVDDNVAEFLWAILQEMKRRYEPQINWAVDLAIYIKPAELFRESSSKE